MLGVLKRILLQKELSTDCKGKGPRRVPRSSGRALVGLHCQVAPKARVVMLTWPRALGRAKARTGQSGRSGRRPPRPVRSSAKSTMPSTSARITVGGATTLTGILNHLYPSFPVFVSILGDDKIGEGLDNGKQRDAMHFCLISLRIWKHFYKGNISFPFSSLLCSLRSLLHSSSPASERKEIWGVAEGRETPFLSVSIT